MTAFTSAPRALATALGLTLLAGCASPPIGSVVPLEGGQFQSNVTAADPQSANKALAHDAQLTCKKEGTQSGKYVVVSQSMKDKDGKDIKSSDNKIVDTTVAVGLRYLGLESQDAVRASTVFKCM